MLNCKEIMGKGCFESYSEFYLALCLAAEMYRRGDKLDMSQMTVQKDELSTNETNYFNYLKAVGAIHIDGVEFEPKEVDIDGLRYYLDMGTITSFKDKLLEDKGSNYFWSPSFLSTRYVGGPSEMLLRPNVGNNLMHIVAYFLVSVYYGELPKKKLVIEFKDMYVKNTYMYVNLYSCSLTLDWFSDYIDLQVDFADSAVDVQYSIFCNNGQVAKRFRKWGINEKRELMKRNGLTEGSIVVLWERSGMNKSNVAGKITKAIIARIDEIGKDFVAVTTLALNKTREEVLMDYYSISEEDRSLFADLLNYHPEVSPKIISLYEMGVLNYFYDEYMFITKLDRREKVTKRITVGGEEADVEMSAIDAIYWLLCQFSIEFDREMYRGMYSDGKPLMWDDYGDDSLEK